MDKKIWYKMLGKDLTEGDITAKELSEDKLNEKKNDFVATLNKVIVSIHNSSDTDKNEKIYLALEKFTTKYQPKKIDITF